MLNACSAKAEFCCHTFVIDRKSTRLNSSHSQISYAVFCLKKKKINMASLLISVNLRQPTLIHALDFLTLLIYLRIEVTPDVLRRSIIILDISRMLKSVDTH